MGAPVAHSIGAPDGSSGAECATRCARTGPCPRRRGPRWRTWRTDPSYPPSPAGELFDPCVTSVPSQPEPAADPGGGGHPAPAEDRMNLSGPAGGAVGALDGGRVVPAGHRRPGTPRGGAPGVRAALSWTGVWGLDPDAPALELAAALGWPDVRRGPFPAIGPGEELLAGVPGHRRPRGRSATHTGAGGPPPGRLAVRGAGSGGRRHPRAAAAPAAQPDDPAGEDPRDVAASRALVDPRPRPRGLRLAHRRGALGRAGRQRAAGRAPSARLPLLGGRRGAGGRAPGRAGAEAARPQGRPGAARPPWPARWSSCCGPRPWPPRCRIPAGYAGRRWSASVPAATPTASVTTSWPRATRTERSDAVT